MALIRSSSEAASPAVMPRPFSPSGRVATVHNSIRFWINTFTADGFVAQERRGTVVAFSPLMKLTSPFFRIAFLETCDRSRLCRRMLLRDSLNPPFNRQPKGRSLSLQRRRLFVRKFDG